MSENTHPIPSAHQDRNRFSNPDSLPNIPRLYETARQVLSQLHTKGESIPSDQLFSTLSSLRRKQMQLWGKPEPASSAFSKLEQVAQEINRIIDIKAQKREQEIARRLLLLNGIEKKLQSVNLLNNQDVLAFQNIYKVFLVDTVQRYPESEATDKALAIIMKLYNALNPASKEQQVALPERFQTAGTILASLEHPQYSADKVISRVLLNGRSAVITAMDGVGSGEQASADAAGLIQSKLNRMLDQLTTVPTVEQAQQLIGTVLIESALEIKQLQHKHRNENIDTTLSLGIVCTDAQNRKILLTANVGDSRIYKFNEHTGQLTQLTTDHSKVAMLVRAGQITKEDAHHHPERNFIYRSVGDIKQMSDIDFTTTEVQDGDTFLAVSDGLTDNMNEVGLQIAISHEHIAASMNPAQGFNMKRFVQSLAARARNIQNEVMRLPQDKRAERNAVSPHIKQDDICVAAFRAVAHTPETTSNLDILSQLESKTQNEKEKAFIKHIQRGIELYKQGMYGNVINLMLEKSIVESIGFTLQHHQPEFISLEQITSDSLSRLALSAAMRSRCDTARRQILISGYFIGQQNIANIDSQNKPALYQLQQEIALISIEEMLHSLQFLLQGTLTGIANHEIDVAQCMRQAGMKMSEFFLRMYNRGNYLDQIQGADDTMFPHHALQKGTFVGIPFSNGTYETNWQIIRQNSQNNTFVVRSSDGLRQLELTKKQIADFNKTLPVPFSHVSTFSQLFSTITQLNGLFGFDQYYTAPELKHLVNQVRQNLIPAEKLPRSGGLRWKVQELIGMEQTNSKTIPLAS